MLTMAAVVRRKLWSITLCSDGVCCNGMEICDYYGQCVSGHAFDCSNTDFGDGTYIVLQVDCSEPTQAPRSARCVPFKASRYPILRVLWLCVDGWNSFGWLRQNVKRRRSCGTGENYEGQPLRRPRRLHEAGQGDLHT